MKETVSVQPALLGLTRKVIVKHIVNPVPNSKNLHPTLPYVPLVQLTNIQSSKTVVVQPAKVARFILEVPIWQATVLIAHQDKNLMVLLLVPPAVFIILTLIQELIARLVH